LDGTFYGPVGVPQAGDLVVYLRDGTPYHVGIVEGEDQIVSSTLNAGIVRTGTDAFAGEVKYLRLVSPESSPASDLAVDPPPAPAGTKPTVAADAAVRHAGAKPARTPHPMRQPPRAQRLTHEKTSSGQPARRTPQPSASRHVKKRVGKATTKPPARSTPSAQLPEQ
jgi:hypothetical protein